MEHPVCEKKRTETKNFNYKICVIFEEEKKKLKTSDVVISEETNI